MRVLTGGELKSGRVRAHRDYPEPNTKAGMIYAALVARKGHPVNLGRIDTFGKGRVNPNIVAVLTDRYGLDVRRIRNGVWILAGEWFGSEYRDYVNEAIDEAVRDQ